MFGVHHATLRQEYRDEAVDFAANTTAEFVRLATDFVEQGRQSWLDVTAYKLNLVLSNWGINSPTVFLVRDHAKDLAHFWNLRAASDADVPAWLIPIPTDGAAEPEVLQRLREWLLAFLPYGWHPNYCHVTSASVSEAECMAFANQLQQVLAGSPIEAVDYAPPRNRLPVVVPYEYEQVWAVEIVGRRLTMQPPRPKAFDWLGRPKSWYVDLKKDIKSGRAVLDMQFPPRPLVLDLLNGPCPPSFELTTIPRVGDGTDGINVRCTDRKEVVNIYIPTGEEVFTAILREHGMEPVPDEKKSSYLPVIKRFGGIHLAAAAFSGQSGAVLTTLASGPKTHPEIQGLCRLGAGDVSGESYLDRIEPMFRTQSDRMKRVSRRRFADYAKHSAPENLRLRSLLEYWADRSIVTRQWRVGPCGRCRQQDDVPVLDIRKRILCAHCGHRITLPANVPVTYQLHRAVQHAVSEGLVPVVLTGRFLKNLSHSGFFWLPGAKYRVGSQVGDIDLLACCDGRIVFAECKRLEGTPPDTKVWQDVESQFIETAKTATRCGASLAVLAARVTDFPQTTKDRLAAAIGSSVPYLLLTAADLDKGTRITEQAGHRVWLSLSDLIPEAFPERRRTPTGRSRTIVMGQGVEPDEEGISA
jgi:hypothetical protein